jgi:hypothetical protein
MPDACNKLQVGAKEVPPGKGVVDLILRWLEIPAKSRLRRTAMLV